MPPSRSVVYAPVIVVMNSLGVVFVVVLLLRKSMGNPADRQVCGFRTAETAAPSSHQPRPPGRTRSVSSHLKAESCVDRACAIARLKGLNRSTAACVDRAPDLFPSPRRADTLEACFRVAIV